MNDIDISTLTFSIPARVLRPVAQRQADLLALAKDNHAIDPAILTERTPFFWSAEISSDVIDAYYTHMLLNTLTNFHADARAGVSFLPGHKHYELPFGRSLDAQIENATEPPRTRVVADFYTLPGLTLNAINTDDLISGLRSGILRDVSVGFFGGRMICDICGRDFWDWDCNHIPGLKYEIKEGDTVKTKLATFGVDNARLTEVSSVFDGATPRAEVLKAEREAAEGRMKPEAVRMIEKRYNVRLPEPKKVFPGADISERKKAMEFEQIVNQIREALGVGDNVDLPGAVLTVQQELDTARGSLSGVSDEYKKAQERIKTLEPQAADGAQYRSDLIAEALAEGVRAYGDKFDSETYTNTLKAAPLATIKRMKADWALVGDSRFAGGRQSQDGNEQAPGNDQQRSRPRVPDSAYKA